MQFISARAKHIGHIAHGLWVLIYSFAWTLLCSIDVVVEHYGTDSFKVAYNNAWIAPKWGWSVWIIGLLVITLLGVLEGSYKYAQKLQEHLDTIENAKPNIVLREPGARHTQEITFYGPDPFRLQFVKVRFINQQKQSGTVVEAKGIRAKLEFFDASGQLLLRMDGRWDSSKHPAKLGQGETFSDLLRMDFGIEEEQNVDVAFWDHFNHRFVAFNNDSYTFSDLTKPGSVLGEGPITANIRLVGVGFDRSYDLQFGLGQDGRVSILS